MAFTHSDLGGRFSLRWPDGVKRLYLIGHHGAQGYVRRVVRGPGEVVLRMPGGGTSLAASWTRRAIR